MSARAPEQRAVRPCQTSVCRPLCKTSKAGLWLSEGWCTACAVSSVLAEIVPSDQRPHGQAVSHSNQMRHRRRQAHGTADCMCSGEWRVIGWLLNGVRGGATGTINARRWRNRGSASRGAGFLGRAPLTTPTSFDLAILAACAANAATTNELHSDETCKWQARVVHPSSSR